LLVHKDLTSEATPLGAGKIHAIGLGPNGGESVEPNTYVVVGGTGAYAKYVTGTITFEKGTTKVTLA
jgi:hypothetical protein